VDRTIFVVVRNDVHIWTDKMLLMISINYSSTSVVTKCLKSAQLVGRGRVRMHMLLRSRDAPIPIPILDLELVGLVGIGIGIGWN
jgi:hypothetical protein